MAERKGPVIGEDLGIHAVVRLSPDNSHGGTHSTRRLVLGPNKLTIKVGRASRTEAKGIVSAEDNAWFDSPVMSRQHAMILFNPRTLAVEIKDLESLHGTYINDHPERLGFWPRCLQDGDKLRFGAPISRGSEHFIPTTVKVGIKVQDAVPCGTYGLRYQEEDDCIDEANSLANSQDRHITNPTDLTDPCISLGPHSPLGDRNRDIVDLPSPPILTRPSSPMSPSYSPPSPQFNYPPSPLPCLESSPKEAKDKDYVPASPRCASPSPQLDAVPDDSSRNGNNTMHSITDEEDADDGMSILSEDSADSRGNMDSLDSLSEDEGDGMHFNENGASLYEAPLSEDDYSPPVGGLDELLFPTDARISESIDFYEAPKQTKTTTHFEIADEFVLTPESADSITTEAGSMEKNVHRTQSRYPGTVSIDAILNTSTQGYATTRSSISAKVSLFHQQPMQDTQFPVSSPSQEKAGYMPPSKNFFRHPPSTLTPPAETMGRKIGKGESISAREANMATFNMLSASKLESKRPSLSVHALCNKVASDTGRERPEAGRTATTTNQSELGWFSTRNGTPTNLTVPNGMYSEFHWLTAGKTFSASPRAGAAGVAEFDSDDEAMTSAVRFHQHKLLSKACGAGSHASRRTHVGIHDIIDGNQSPETQMKRKSHDISSVTNADVQWSRGSGLQSFEPEKPVTSTAGLAVVQSLGSTTASAGTPSSTSNAAVHEAVSPGFAPVLPVSPKMPVSMVRHDPDSDRPQKRRRLPVIAERLTYVAMGGVFSGAVILVTLICTAPSFT